MGQVPYDAIIAGGGPAGLSAAEALAKRGCSALVLEQGHEIGSPIRTSGGSFSSLAVYGNLRRFFPGG
jgi:flavin-dependent dehydrogenase